MRGRVACEEEKDLGVLAGREHPARPAAIAATVAFAASGRQVSCSSVIECAAVLATLAFTSSDAGPSARSPLRTFSPSAHRSFAPLDPFAIRKPSGIRPCANARSCSTRSETYAGPLPSPSRSEALASIGMMATGSTAARVVVAFPSRLL